MTAEDLAALRARHQAYEDLVRTSPERRDQAADDRGDLLAYLASDPPGDEPPIMCRRLSDGLAAVSWDIFARYGETIVAIALRGVRDPLPGELLPTGPLGPTRDGREATLHVVLSQDRPAIAVYFGDTRALDVERLTHSGTRPRFGSSFRLMDRERTGPNLGSRALAN